MQFLRFVRDFLGGGVKYHCLPLVFRPRQAGRGFGICKVFWAAADSVFSAARKLVILKYEDNNPVSNRSLPPASSPSWPPPCYAATDTSKGKPEGLSRMELLLAWRGRHAFGERFLDALLDGDLSLKVGCNEA